MHADSRAAAVQPATADAAPAPLTLSNFFSELGVRRFPSLCVSLVSAHCRRCHSTCAALWRPRLRLAVNIACYHGLRGIKLPSELPLMSSYACLMRLCCL